MARHRKRLFKKDIERIYEELKELWYNLGTVEFGLFSSLAMMLGESKVTLVKDVVERLDEDKRICFSRSPRTNALEIDIIPF